MFWKLGVFKNFDTDVFGESCKTFKSIFFTEGLGTTLKCLFWICELSSLKGLNCKDNKHNLHMNKWKKNKNNNKNILSDLMFELYLYKPFWASKLHLTWITFKSSVLLGRVIVKRKAERLWQYFEKSLVW